MVRVSPRLGSFNAGEVSQLIYGRPDFVRYRNGLRACRGFIPLPEGPATRVPGTKMIGEVKGNAPGRFMAFVFRDEDAVMLEWTDQLLRFWRNGSLVQFGGGDLELPTPYPLASLPNLQARQSNDRIYLVDGDRAPQRLSRFAIDNWTIDDTPFENGPFGPRNLDTAQEITPSGVTGTINLVANFDKFEASHIGGLFELIQVNQTDAPYWTGNTPVQVGSQMYYDGNLYEVAGFDLTNGTTGPTAPTNDGASPTPNAISAAGGAQWTYVTTGTTENAPDWSANDPIAIGDRRHSAGHIYEVVGFDASGRTSGNNPPVHDAGTWLSETGGVVWDHVSDNSGIVRITAVADLRNATATVEKRLPDGLSGSATYRWAEGAWSDLNGWPRSIGSFEQRILYGGSITFPRTVWSTVLGGTVDMEAGVNDDDGFSYNLASPRRNSGEIRNMVAVGTSLFIGTAGDEFVGTATDADRAFGPQTARFNSDTSKGVMRAEALSIDGPLFLHKNGRRIFTLQFDPSSGKYMPSELTQIARHILGPGCSKIVYQEEPIPVVWCLLTNGQLAGLTYLPEQQVLAWHAHDLAGGVVEDIEVLPTDDGVAENLWLWVNRTVQGQTKRFVEIMQDPFVDLDGDDPDMEDAWHQFCAVRYQGAATTDIAGLDHLEGETVTAWTELGAFDGLTVTGGQVTLGRAVTSAIVGLDGTDSQKLETLDLTSGAQDGGEEGRLRTHRATGAMFHQTAGGRIQICGIEDGHLREEPAERFFNLDAFSNPELRSGIFQWSGGRGFHSQKFLRVTPQPGAPITVQVLTPTTMLTDS